MYYDNASYANETTLIRLLLSCQGSGIHSSEVVQGMVFKREVEGDIKALKDAKIVAFSCPLDSMATETKVR